MYSNKVKKKSIRRKLSRYNRNKLSNKRKSKRTNKKIKRRRSYNKRKLQRGGGDTSILTLLSQLGLDKHHKRIVTLMEKSPVPPEPITGIEYLQKLDGEDPDAAEGDDGEDPDAAEGDDGNRIGNFFANVGMSEAESKMMITALRSGIRNLLEVVLPQTDPADIETRISEIGDALASSGPGRVPIVNIKGLYEFKTHEGNFERFGMSREESGRLMEELECPKLHEHLLYTSPLRENLAMDGRAEGDVILRKGEVYEGITVFKDSTAARAGRQPRATRASYRQAQALCGRAGTTVKPHPGGQRGEPPKHYLKCDFCGKAYIHRTNGDGGHEMDEQICPG